RRGAALHRPGAEGKALRVGSRDAGGRLVAPGPRRIRLPAGFPDRAASSRRAPHGDRGGYERSPADRDRTPAPSRRLMPAPRTATGDLLARARSGDKRSIARLVSVVENDEPGAAEAMRELYPTTGRAQTVGITGPPGGGKSTLVNRLAGLYRERAARGAILGVDPSSPFSGGATRGARRCPRSRADAVAREGSPVENSDRPHLGAVRRRATAARRRDRQAPRVVARVRRLRGAPARGRAERGRGAPAGGSAPRARGS